ncbi:hypothetical protein Scep_007581 [Stephania cephalantha]|uniref:Uncharacterized protein n=1 Tax=Stephania cephalantha TaxID=152367 RepID=A0AAP0PNE7_9MAGN
MTDQREAASSAGGSQGLTGGRLPTAPAVGDSRQWEETTNAAGSEQATPPEVIRAAAKRQGRMGRRQSGGKCNQPLHSLCVTK